MVKTQTSGGPALLEKTAKACIAILDSGARRALVWALLGGAIGLVAVLGTQFVVHFAEARGASIGGTVVMVVSGLVIAISAGLFALYGLQVGAIEGALGIEPELGLIRAVVDLALADVRSRFGDRFAGATVEDVDDLAIVGTRKVLGAPDASWKGPFGVVARIVFRVVSTRFEGQLRSVLMETTERAGAQGEVVLDAVATDVRAGFVREAEDVSSSLLKIQFGVIVVGVLGVALLWYPIAARVISILRR